MKKATKECPICGNFVFKGVNMCTSCGYDFDSFEIKNWTFSPSLFWAGILTLAANIALPAFSQLAYAPYLGTAEGNWLERLPFSPMILLLLVGGMALLWVFGWFLLVRNKEIHIFIRSTASLVTSAVFLLALLILFNAIFYSGLSSGFFDPMFTDMVTFTLPNIISGIIDLFIIAFLVALMQQKRSSLLLLLGGVSIFTLAPCSVLCMMGAFTKNLGTIYTILIPIAFTLASISFVTASFIRDREEWRWP